VERPERRAPHPIRAIEVDQIADLACTQGDDGSRPRLLVVIVGVHLPVSPLGEVIELGVRMRNCAGHLSTGRQRVIRTAITAMKLTEANGLRHSRRVAGTELGVNKMLN
jgi:hypothetical protein